MAFETGECHKNVKHPLPGVNLFLRAFSALTRWTPPQSALAGWAQTDLFCLVLVFFFGQLAVQGLGMEAMSNCS